MKVKLQSLVKDPDVARYKVVKLTQTVMIESEDFFLDGPISRRVAVVDFDPATGSVTQGAQFLPPDKRNKYGRYKIPRKEKITDPAFMQVTTFGGVYKTISMFEEDDTLGRRVQWAFPGPQLLVVPRAGEWPNAFYERDSRSIQLFYFSQLQSSSRVYTCHSQDIVSHETAHAIIDGVVPDLYHAASPEGLAIHEAIADISTLMMSFRSRELAAKILKQTNGSLEHPNVFTEIAEQFGSAIKANRGVLRDLRNEKTMQSLGSNRSEPHALSEVLSGALYSLMLRIYNDLMHDNEEEEIPKSSVGLRGEFLTWAASGDPSAISFKEGHRHGTSAGRALFIASERFKRTVLRALDYLPPGEVSFADYGRAIIASDQASHPDSLEQRDWLKEEFVKRGIIQNVDELDMKTNFEHPAVTALDLDELMQSDWLAYQFANKNRSLLNIPRSVPFEVRPRLKVKKKYYHRDSEVREEWECLLKVCWVEDERNLVGGGLPQKRRIVRGTTLAIDWEKKLVRAVVTGEKSVTFRHSRDAFVTRLLDLDLIHVSSSHSPNGRYLRNGVNGLVVQDALFLQSTARTLHICEVR